MSRPPIQPRPSNLPAFGLRKTVDFSQKRRDTPAYVFHVVATGHGLAATSSTHEIKLYDALRLDSIQTVGYHDDTITQVKCIDNQNLLLTSSKDQTVLAWDLRTKVAQPSQKFKSTAPLLSFDADLENNILATGSEFDGIESKLQIWDIRSSGSMHSYVASHSNDITGLSFSQKTAGQLLSSSTDGLLGLFNVKETNEDEAMVSSANVNASIGRAGYIGQNSDQIFVMTDMETLSLWSHELDPIADFGDMRVMDQSGLELDYMINGFYDHNTKQFFVAMGSNSGDINVLSVQPDSLQLYWNMPGGHNEIVRDLVMDTSSGIVISGGEDGKLSLWSSSDNIRTSASSGGQASSRRSKHGNGAGAPSEAHTRFSPY